MVFSVHMIDRLVIFATIMCINIWSDGVSRESGLGSCENNGGPTQIYLTSERPEKPDPLTYNKMMMLRNRISTVMFFESPCSTVNETGRGNSKIFLLFVRLFIWYVGIFSDRPRLGNYAYRSRSWRPPRCAANIWPIIQYVCIRVLFDQVVVMLATHWR